MKNSTFFFNRCFDKTRLKNFILWFFNKYGANETIKLVENLKNVGFEYATKTGISLGIDDLKIPLIKSNNIKETEEKIKKIEFNFQKGNLTEIERKQQFIEEWIFASDKLKTSVVQFFKATNIFNSIYMIAFSGARGNISQVRQLIGMRGLMVDPQGEVLEFPIRSNFREGLNLTEYIISCYGARKGVVDTALRTATSGYLTRRLVDVTQHVIIGKHNCKTTHGIKFVSLIDGNKILLPLKNRLVGRILLNDVFETCKKTKKKKKIGEKNQEISSKLALKLTRSKKSIVLRSPLCCSSKNFICQLCYGWSLAHSKIVSIGEAVGVLAAQSIGEPGTQLTMRTFHTGGIFTGGIIDQIYAPFNGKIEYLDILQGKLIRTLNGQIGFLSKIKGRIQIKRQKKRNLKLVKEIFQNFSISKQLKRNLLPYKNNLLITSQIRKIESKLNLIKSSSNSFLLFNTPIYTIFFIRNKCFIHEKTLIAELSSPSFFKKNQQETEQEIFAPESGQIFFENLILIEKINKDGIIQKKTYGLGSIWLIAGFFINNLFGQKGFPIHGDFLEVGSTTHKIQIIIERNFKVDVQLFYLYKKISNFNKRFFSIKNKNYLTKKKIFSNIFLSRSIFSLNFVKVNYKSFKYFILVSFQIFRPNLIFYYELKFFNYSYKIYFKPVNNFQQIGLNFSFSTNNKQFPIVSKIYNSKSNFLFYNILNQKNEINKKFFVQLTICEAIKSKLQKPIISRKKELISLKDIMKYYYWLNFIDSNLLKNKELNIYNWLYYLKKYREHSLDFELKSSLRESKKYLSNFNFFDISLKSKNKEKNFFLKTYLAPLNNKKFRCNFTKITSNKVLTKLIWLSHYQICFNLINRQGLLYFQLFNSYQLINYSSIKLQSKINSPINLNNYQNLKYFISLKINQNIFFFPFFQKKISKKKNLKPVLFYLNNFKNNHYFYIIRYFLLLNKQEYHSIYLSKKSNINTKDKLKIGYKTRFRSDIIPSLNYKDKNLIFLASQQNSFQKKISTLFNIGYQSNLKNKQLFLTWVCFTPINYFLEKYNNLLKLGSFFSSGIRFDNQEIIIDIIYLKRKKLKLNHFWKNQLKLSSNFNWINNKKVRFKQKVKIISKLIIFKKSLINPSNCFKNPFLNSTLSNKLFFQLLVLNIKKKYYNFFKKKSFKSKIFKNPIKFNYLSNIFSDKIFLKTEYIINTVISINCNQKFFIFLESYNPIFKKYENHQVQTNELTNSNKHLLFNNFLKRINFTLIKKFDFNLLNNQIAKNQKLIKIFHLYSEPDYFKSEVNIKFLIKYKGGEFIRTKTNLKKIDCILINRLNLKIFFINLNSKKSSVSQLIVGNFIRYGDKIDTKKIVIESGQIIYIDNNKFIIRRATPFLLTARSILNVNQNEVVKKNSRLFKFLYHKIKTGDIIQGIPKIEELFEARITRSGIPLLTNLHYQCKKVFKYYSLQFSIYKATQKSFEFIQKLIIDEIQKIYCSQGVYIADKHLEIVVRQMTSKVQIIEGGKTGLLCGELIEFDWAYLINKQLKRQEILYEPIILGITKSCLETESFISAASFQETTRILSKAAIQNKIDFIRGLKQNVILGSLIPAGTGFFSPLYFKSIQD
nr:RNA polymerase beta'' subunit [Ostreobium quekettii]UXE30659.1 RNA polymerase beta'' subunit [Ostreobium quekettii]UXE30735.1 RNA polymerase beta'' subunit [Ostreobium quekettii]UXE30811.1 RNA polymerase beta'' subunit [Ostreobium quekettii]